MRRLLYGELLFSQVVHFFERLTMDSGWLLNGEAVFWRRKYAYLCESGQVRRGFAAEIFKSENLGFGFAPHLRHIPVLCKNVVLMIPSILTQYARLLTRYCMDVKPGDKVFISSTLLAEPLLREVYREAYAAGAALVEYDLAFRERERLMMENASDAALATPPVLTRLAMETFDCYLNIRAPFNLRETSGATPERAQLRSETLAPVSKAYFERTADRRLRRNPCQYPTDAAPRKPAAGQGVRAVRVRRLQTLHRRPAGRLAAGAGRPAAHRGPPEPLLHRARYLTEGTDITFSTKGRTWMNSTDNEHAPPAKCTPAPVEDGVDGTVHFSYPCIYQGNEVEGVTLWVKDGLASSSEARRAGVSRLHFHPARHAAFRRSRHRYQLRHRPHDENTFRRKRSAGLSMAVIAKATLQTGGKKRIACPLGYDRHDQRRRDMGRRRKIYESGSF